MRQVADLVKADRLNRLNRVCWDVAEQRAQRLADRTLQVKPVASALWGSCCALDIGLSCSSPAVPRLSRCRVVKPAGSQLTPARRSREWQLIAVLLSCDVTCCPLLSCTVRWHSETWVKAGARELHVITLCL